MAGANRPVNSQWYTGSQMNVVSFEQTHRLVALVGRLMRYFRSIFGEQPAPLSELIVQVEEAPAPARLAAALNSLQDRLWQLSSQEQSRFREIIIKALKRHALHHASLPVRREAANWLRLYVQARQVADPASIFATLVEAAVQFSSNNEPNPYLPMIFDCFWPFRHPYQVYTWDEFPPNDVFYPLAPLFEQADPETESLLFAIFAELPSLADPTIRDHILPVALRWSLSEDVERRRRVVPVLARIDDAAALDCLTILLADPDSGVRAAARTAARSGDATSS